MPGINSLESGDVSTVSSPSKGDQLGAGTSRNTVAQATETLAIALKAATLGGAGAKSSTFPESIPSLLYHVASPEAARKIVTEGLRLSCDETRIFGNTDSKYDKMMRLRPFCDQALQLCTYPEKVFKLLADPKKKPTKADVATSTDKKNYLKNLLEGEDRFKLLKERNQITTRPGKATWLKNLTAEARGVFVNRDFFDKQRALATQIVEDDELTKILLGNSYSDIQDEIKVVDGKIYFAKTLEVVGTYCKKLFDQEKPAVVFFLEKDTLTNQGSLQEDGAQHDALIWDKPVPAQDLAYFVAGGVNDLRGKRPAT